MYIFLLIFKYLSSTHDLIQSFVFQFQLLANDCRIYISGLNIASESQTLSGKQLHTLTWMTNRNLKLNLYKIQLLIFPLHLLLPRSSLSCLMATPLILIRNQKTLHHFLLLSLMLHIQAISKSCLFYLPITSRIEPLLITYTSTILLTVTIISAVLLQTAQPIYLLLPTVARMTL